MIMGRLFAIALVCAAPAAYIARSPSALAYPSHGTAEGGWRIYDPGDSLKEFKLQAHPEACVGTPESIEAAGRSTIKRIGHFAVVSLLRLIPEPVPPGTPAGWRGFRFTGSDRVILGTVCGVVYDQETGHVVFVMSDTSPADHSGRASLSTRQDATKPFESHILVPPNGYVSPELIVSDRASSDGSDL